MMNNGNTFSFVKRVVLNERSTREVIISKGQTHKFEYAIKKVSVWCKPNQPRETYRYKNVK